MRIMKNIVYLLVALLFTSIFSSCSQSVDNSIHVMSFESYKNLHAKKLTALITDRTTDNGILDYNSTAFDPYATFYALKIFETLNVKLEINELGIKTIERNIYETIELLNEEQSIHTLDKLWYLVNTYSIITTEEFNSDNLYKALLNCVQNYITKAVHYDDMAEIYRISMIQDVLMTKLLDNEKTTVFVKNFISEINYSTVIDIAYPLLRIAESNNVIIKTDVLKDIFEMADTKMKSIYNANEVFFPDFYQLFELICLLDNDYNFKSDSIMTIISKLQDSSGLYRISPTEQVNYLPTYWAIQILKEINMDISKGDTMILSLKQSKMLDGLYNSINTYGSIPEEANAARYIYKMLSDDENSTLEHTVKTELKDMSSIAIYIYIRSLNMPIATEIVSTINSEIYSKLNEISEPFGLATLFNTYFLISSLESMQQPINQDTLLNILTLLEQYDKTSLQNDELTLYYLLSDVVKKVINNNDYSISKETEQIISSFMNTGYKTYLKNDTLFCLYLCVEIFKNDPILINKYKESGLQILETLLDEDGMFFYGIDNEVATFNSTFIGLEILNVLEE